MCVRCLCVSFSGFWVSEVSGFDACLFFRFLFQVSGLDACFFFQVSGFLRILGLTCVSFSGFFFRFLGLTRVSSSLGWSVVLLTRFRVTKSTYKSTYNLKFQR